MKKKVMNYNLDNFEEFIDKKMLAKGKEYWQNGLLSPLDYEENGKWHAVANSRELLHVFISLRENNNNAIIDCQCGCVRNTFLCKHIVAVLYKLKENLTMKQ